MVVSSLDEGIAVDVSALVSVLMTWLSLSAWSGGRSVLNAVRSAFMDEISVGFILKNDSYKNRLGLFLIGQKICFMTLVFWSGVPKVGARNRAKLSCFCHMSYECRSEHFRLRTDSVQHFMCSTILSELPFFIAVNINDT